MTLDVPQRGEGRATHGARRPQRRRDARARAGPLAGRPGQDARRAGGAGRRARPGRARRCASSATTSAPSRAPTPWAAWSCSRRAGRAAATTAASGSGRWRAPTTSPATGRSSGAASGARCERGGERRGAALAAARPGHHRRRQGPGERGPRGPRRAGPARPAAGRAWPRSARSCSCPAARTRSCCRPRSPASTSSSACATRRTASPSPTTASCAPRRRRSRRSTTCPASGRPASGRCCGSSARRAQIREASVERDRRRARHRHGARGAHQGRRSTPDRGVGPSPSRSTRRRRPRVPDCYSPGRCVASFPFLIVAVVCSRSPSCSVPNFPRPFGGDAGVRRDAPRARPRGRPAGRVPGGHDGRLDAARRATWSTTRTIIENRVNATGVAEPIVADPGRRPDHRSSCRAPTEQEEIRSLIGTTGPPRLRGRAAGIYGTQDLGRDAAAAGGRSTRPCRRSSAATRSTRAASRRASTRRPASARSTSS